MQHRKKMAIIPILLMLSLSVASSYTVDNNKFIETDNNQNIFTTIVPDTAFATELPNYNEDYDYPIMNGHPGTHELTTTTQRTTTPPADIMAPTNMSLSQKNSFMLSRDIAIQFVLGKVLRALGPKFEDSFPPLPTVALNSTLRVQTGMCPAKYRRCSSQTFYPSCEIPRNTDEAMWNSRFTLFFNISSEISSIKMEDVLNATIRLYKNISLPLSQPITLIVRLHAFSRSIKRNRERSVVLAWTRVSSDYVGWVFIDVEKLIRRLLKGRRFNHGVKIAVSNENDVPWNIPNLFVKMDCQASNETLVPLPFEIQLDDTAQRYPALNIRSGSQEMYTDNNDYLNGFGIQTRDPNSNQIPEQRVSTNHQRQKTRRNGRPNQNNNMVIDNHNYNLNQQHINSNLNAESMSQTDMTSGTPVGLDAANHYEDPSDKYYSDESYLDRHSVPVISTSSNNNEQIFPQQSRQQHHHRKTSGQHNTAQNFQLSSNNPDYDHVQSSHENLIENSHIYQNTPTTGNSRLVDQNVAHGHEVPKYEYETEVNNRQSWTPHAEEYENQNTNQLNQNLLNSNKTPTLDNIIITGKNKPDGLDDKSVANDDYYLESTGHRRGAESRSSHHRPNRQHHRRSHRHHRRHRHHLSRDLDTASVADVKGSLHQSES